MSDPGRCRSLFARERDTAVWKESDWNDLHEGHEAEDGKEERTTSLAQKALKNLANLEPSQGGPEADKERLRKGDEAQLNVLGNEIEKELVILSDSEKALEQQQQSFSVFLNDQGWPAQCRCHMTDVLLHRPSACIDRESNGTVNK